MTTTTLDTGAAPPAGRPHRGTFVRLVSRWGTIASLLVLIGVFSALEPDIFPTQDNFLSILNQVAILGIVSVGLTVCLVMGLFDLSIASMATLIGFLVSKWLADDMPVAQAIALGLLCAVAIGIANGIAVSYLGISAFIATLAMGSILTGVVLRVSNSESILTGIPDAFLELGQGTAILGIPNPVLFMVATALILYVLLEHTELGRNMYAIGSNAEASRLSGIKVRRYAAVALGISAVCAALGGIIVTANLGIGRPQGVGDTYLLDAFAAAFIGAATLRAGRFDVLGTMVGVLLIGVVNNGLSVTGVDTSFQYVVRGALLLMAVFASGLAAIRTAR